MGGINALEVRRRILLNTPHVETASGSIATFQTDMVGKLKECKIYFEPVQEGSGDPSPDNVRPITGWTGCEVTVSPTTQSSDGTTIPIDWTNEAGTVYGGYVDLVKGEVVAKWISYLFDGTQRLSSTWYGADRQRGFNSSGFYWYLNHLNLPLAKTGANRTIISDKLARNIYGCYGSDLNYIFGITVQATTSVSYISMRLPNDVLDISSASALMTSISLYLADNPVRIAYEIATPIHYPIDPIALKTLSGTNNIFANTNGNIEIKFYTH